MCLLLDKKKRRKGRTPVKGRKATAHWDTFLWNLKKCGPGKS